MKCPDCNREMRAKTSRTPEGAWTCDYCRADWTRVESIRQSHSKTWECVKPGGDGCDGKHDSDEPQPPPGEEAFDAHLNELRARAIRAMRSSDTYQAHHCRHGTRGVYCFDFHPSHEREKCDNAREAALKSGQSETIRSYDSKDGPK